MEIIRCEGLSKIYQAGENKVFALDNVDLTIEQGSFTAITGPSGSGKSTLLHLLSGLDTPARGASSIRGRTSTITRITSCPCCAAAALALCFRATIWCVN